MGSSQSNPVIGPMTKTVFPKYWVAGLPRAGLCGLGHRSTSDDIARIERKSPAIAARMESVLIHKCVGCFDWRMWTCNSSTTCCNDGISCATFHFLSAEMSVVAVGGSVGGVGPAGVGLTAFSRYRTHAASNFAFAVLIQS